MRRKHMLAAMLTMLALLPTFLGVVVSHDYFLPAAMLWLAAIIQWFFSFDKKLGDEHV